MAASACADKVRPFLITSFSVATAPNSQARATTNSYPRRCSKPATEVHSHSTSSAALHFSFARPAATTASSVATRPHPDLAPLWRATHDGRAWNV